MVFGLGVSGVFLNVEIQFGSMTSGIRYIILIIGIVSILLLVLVLSRIEINMTQIACDTFGNPGLAPCG